MKRIAALPSEGLAVLLFVANIFCGIGSFCILVLAAMAVPLAMLWLVVMGIGTAAGYDMNWGWRLIR